MRSSTEALLCRLSDRRPLPPARAAVHLRALVEALALASERRFALSEAAILLEIAAISVASYEALPRRSAAA